MKERLNIKVKGGLPLFKIKMADAKFLKDMMGAISILVDEATFDLTPDGIKASRHGSLTGCHGRF